jgi:ferredoxin--NADP+ reductase
MSSEQHICTDDGSHGRKGFVTEVLKELLQQDGVDQVVAIGPVPMRAEMPRIRSTNI